MSYFSLKNGLTPRTCKIHLPPSIVAISSWLISSFSELSGSSARGRSARPGSRSGCSPGFSPLEKLPSRRPLLSLEISPCRQGRRACPAGRDIPHTHKTGTSSASGRNGRCRSPPALRPRRCQNDLRPASSACSCSKARSLPEVKYIGGRLLSGFGQKKSGVLISQRGKENAAVCGVVFNFRCVTIWAVGFTGGRSVSKLNPKVVNR